MILMEENFSVFDIDSDQAVLQKNWILKPLPNSASIISVHQKYKW